MRSLYISQSGCYLSLKQEQVLIKQGQTVLDQVQLPLVEQILVFGQSQITTQLIRACLCHPDAGQTWHDSQSQITTQLIRACLWRNIPIVYLSRMGRCYGRMVPIERGYRSLARQQQLLSPSDRLKVAKSIIRAKLKNSRVILQRQRRRCPSETLSDAIKGLTYLIYRAEQADSTERLMGFEGAAAACYFGVLGECLMGHDFTFQVRSRQPPKDPVNAMLSFGYQLLWNHLLSLLELQGLDPYEACLHQGSERHAALASDLIEEFRAPVIDSLVLFLVNSHIVSVETDFDYPGTACYLNDQGRKKFLRAFLQRMETAVTTVDGQQEPRWALLNRQVKAYKQFVGSPSLCYKPYVIR